MGILILGVRTMFPTILYCYDVKTLTVVSWYCEHFFQKMSRPLQYYYWNYYCKMKKPQTSLLKTKWYQANQKFPEENDIFFLFSFWYIYHFLRWQDLIFYSEFFLEWIAFLLPLLTNGTIVVSESRFLTFENKVSVKPNYDGKIAQCAKIS